MTEEEAEQAAGEPPPAGIVAPYGSWASPIDVELVAAASVGLAEVSLDGDDVYWLEGRSAEGGRRTLLRRGLDASTVELTPAPFNVRNRVHEYGGASYVVDAGRIVASNAADGRLYWLDEGMELDPITPEGPWRYADLRFDPVRERLYAVRETHDAEREHDPLLVVNELVTISLDGSDGPGRVLVSGPDFVAAPRPSPDGTRLAWIEWDLPDMPWDATRLRVADVAADGSLSEPRTVAGGPGVSVVQPGWSPGGVLHAVSDETEWWNLYAFDGLDGTAGAGRNLAPMDAELGEPAWVFGISSYGFLADGSVVAVARAEGTDSIVRIGRHGAVTHLDQPFTEVHSFRVDGDGVIVAIGAGPRDGAILVRLDAATGEVRGVLARSLRGSVDAAYLPEPEPITFRTPSGATARALYFAPTNPGFRGPDGELPPLIVESHGGPTGAAYSALSLDRAFFTSRGIAVVDVDYRGSSGYGRPYRDALKGQWGIADVEDCVAAAEFLVARGSVDGARLAIRGGSAGGYTTLASLTFRPEVFAAGISHFGIADLELIHNDGHKFESRYDEGLLAPWTEEGRRVFRERSPIHYLDRVRAPMLIFQGMDDRVVPPSQLDAMEAAFEPRGIPYVAMRFEGEGHGFRRADSRRATYEAEIAFLGRVFGFTPDDDVPPLEIPGLETFAAAMAGAVAGGDIR
jgi:dipeptidyl aminopeptidase/acylaminoacyl peptidase